MRFSAFQPSDTLLYCSVLTMLQFDQATLDTLEEEFMRIAFDLFSRHQVLRNQDIYSRIPSLGYLGTGGRP